MLLAGSGGCPTWEDRWVNVYKRGPRGNPTAAKLERAQPHVGLRTSWSFLRPCPRGLTVMGDDGPGHGRGVDAANHPEHAEPAEVLATLLLGQELRVVGENDGDGPPNAGRGESNFRRGTGRPRHPLGQNDSGSPCAGTSGDAFQLLLGVFANLSRPRLPSDTLLCSAGGGGGCP